MNVFSAWIFSILAVVIIGVIADLVLSGKLKNFCRSVFSATAVLIIVIPIPTVLRNGCNSIDNVFDFSVSLDEAYISANSMYIAEKLESGIVEALAKDGIKGIELEVLLNSENPTEIKAIKINIKNLVIENKMLHINKYDYLKKKVTEYSNVAEEMIYIYE